MDNYRGIHVAIHLGKSQSYVSVIARTTRSGDRRDRLVYRAAVDLGDAPTVAAVLRVAAEQLLDAADRL